MLKEEAKNIEMGTMVEITGVRHTFTPGYLRNNPNIKLIVGDTGRVTDVKNSYDIQLDDNWYYDYRDLGKI